MIVSHLLLLYSVKSQGNAAMSTGVKSSVSYYRKWKLITSEIGAKLKNQENSKFSKKNKILVQIYWTHVRPVRPPVGAPGARVRFFYIDVCTFTTSTICRL